MSEPIPESIPQSQAPRSRPPTKRSAPTPRTQQATHLASLFSKSDREIPLPPSTNPACSSNSSSKPHAALPAPPEIVANVQGSSAGAGSGEFHVYKASRRREYERVKMMEEEVAREAADRGFWEKREERRKVDEGRTEKRRRKRERVKGRRNNGRKESPGEMGEEGEEGDGEEGEKGEGDGKVGMKSVEGAGVVICDDD